MAARGDSKLLRRLTQLRKLQDETLDLVRNLEFKTADEEMQVLALKKYIQATLDLTAEIRALVRKP